MIKIYLNSKDRLVIERNGVRRLVSSLWNFPIIDSNREVIEIPNILKETSFNDIKKENGESYYNFLELESMLFYSFNNKPTDTPFVPTVPIRRFSHREGGLLIDDIGDRNADVLFPVSSFNGVDSQARIPMVFNSSVDYNRYKISFSASTMTSYKVIVGLHIGLSGALGTLYTNKGRLICVAFGKSFEIPVDVYIVNEIVNLDVTIDLLNDTLLVLKNGVELYKNISMGYVANVNNIPGLDLGNLNNSGAFNGLVYNFNQYNRDGDIIFSSNLPHLGYGFDENNNPVELTNTNVGVDYIKEGSTWMLDKGCVRRGDIVIPNKPDGSTISLEEGDVVIESSAFINDSPLMIDTTGGESDIAILNKEEYAAYKKTDVDRWNDDIRSDEHYDGNPFKWSASELFNVDSFSQTGVNRVSISGDEIILYNKNYK